MAATNESYRTYRRQLLAAGFPIVAVVVFAVTALYCVVDALTNPDFIDAWLRNAVALALPAVALFLGLGRLRNRLDAVVLGFDAALTLVLSSGFFVPTDTVSGAALFLSLKMVGTALLIRWDPRFQCLSTGLTLLLYFALLALAPRAPTAFLPAHLILGPLVAGVFSIVGAFAIDRAHREIFLRNARLAESQKRLRSMLDTERVLVEMTREISVLSDRSALLERINRLTAQALGCDASHTFLLDDARAEFRSLSGYGPDEELRRRALDVTLPVRGRLGRELLRGRVVVANDPASQTWGDPEMFLRYGVHRAALAPIVWQNNVLGVLTASSRNPGPPFSQREITLLGGIATQAGIAMENARLFERLAVSEAKYRDLFERANDLVFVLDERGRFTFANQAALDFLAVSSEEIGQVSLDRILSAEQRRRIARRMRVARRRSADPRRGFTVTVMRPDGNPATLELHTRVIDSPGEMRVYQCIARDVTERQRQEQATLELLEQLREANRLQSEFVANMSHELRTPLNVIFGYADLLLEDAEFQRNPNFVLFLNRVVQGARALHRLVESILEYARLRRGAANVVPRRFALDELLAELRTLCEEVRTNPQVAITVWEAPGIELETDYNRLYTILSNLLLNALKFTPSGEVELQTRTDNGTVEFTVSDTGIGITPDQQTRIFEPFYQLDGSPTRSFGGVGLGLTIVRRNVDLLGGTVEIESRAGTGSTFRVRIAARLSETHAHPTAAEGP